MNIALETRFARLSIEEIKGAIQKHIQPMTKLLPDKRPKRVVEDMVLGILGGETLVIKEIAWQNRKEDGASWDFPRWKKICGDVFCAKRKKHPHIYYPLRRFPMNQEFLAMLRFEQRFNLAKLNFQDLLIRNGSSC